MGAGVDGEEVTTSKRKSRFTSGMRATGNGIRSTPQDFFDALDAEFHFDIDVCALPENAKCARYFTPEQDGLAQEWRGVCWMNPPYGNEIMQWVTKAHEAAAKGATVVALLPSRTDNEWFQDHVLPYAELRFVRGRLHFSGMEDGAPFPSLVAIYRPPKGQA